MESKPWYKSKTVWINVSAAVGILAAFMTGDLDKAGALGQLAPIGLALLNVVLRLVTKSPIE